MSKTRTYKWLMTYCRHYQTHNGRFPSCAVGIDVKSLPTVRGNRVCFKPSIGGCVMREEKDPVETRRMVDELDTAMRAAVHRLNSGLCPHCGAEPESVEVVGRCSYAKPCGHRIGQVRTDDGGRDDE
jgi:hypothetical protein